MTSDLLWAVVFLQLLMGASDTLFHHEFSEKLAWQPSAQNELKLHAIRNFIYSGLFLCFAWGVPHGLFALLAIGFILIEVVITLWDFVEEDLSRKLPPSERVLHTLLALNYGAILALLMPALWGLFKLNTAYVPIYYGWGSWVLTFAGIGVFVFGVRDTLAANRLSHLKRGPAGDLAKALKGHHHILITGATGFIGKRLTAGLIENGHSVTVSTRNPQEAARLGSPLNIITSLDEIRDDAPVDAIINLAGEPLANGLWTKAKRERIVKSRLDLVAQIERLCARLYVPPKTVIIASAIGWYGLRGDDELSEESKAAPCFTHHVCQSLEQAADRLKAYHCRVVNLRIGLVLGSEGGMLANLLVPFEYGLGGPIGSGKQWMSWIDLDDVIRLIVHALKTNDLEGPVNGVAPSPVRNQDFAKALGGVLNRPAILPVSATLLKLGLGDMAKELLLGSQRVVPEKALSSGFVFQASTLSEALGKSLPFKPLTSRSTFAHNNIICPRNKL